MPLEIKLPELGEGLEAGDIIDVKVSAGTTVSKGQALLELEAEKSTVEVPSPSDGRITQVLVKKGDRIQVGQSICLMEQSEGADAAPAEKSAKPAKSVEQQAVRTEPKTTPAATPAKGPEKSTPAGENGEQRSPRNLFPPNPIPRRWFRPARQRADWRTKLGVDLSQVSGSAEGGRITQEDVKAYVRELTSRPAASAGGITVPPLPDFERWGKVERKPLDGIRRKTAEQMSRAWHVVAQVTQHDHADVTELEAFRKEQNGGDVKLTMSAFALKAAAIALKHFPDLNASLDTAAGQIVLKRYYHIGVAVDTDRGLLVPVLRDVDRKSVTELARELAEAAERARQKKMAADEMRGGTFTITNLGGIGGSGFSPIVNYPEVAILGMSRARLQPWVHEGQIVPRLILPLSLSYDHRLIDGALAARFTRFLAEMLEKPLRMLLA